MVVDAATLQGQDGPSVARFAEQILERMEEEASVNPLVLPTTVAWANSRDSSAGKRAESVLVQMQQLYESGNPDVKPDTVSFNSVITAWANSGDPSAGKRAEVILVQMQQLNESGNLDVKPNTVSFNSVITAWANSGNPSAAKRAETILKRMYELRKSGDRNVSPNVVTYNSVISAFEAIVVV